MAQTDRGDAAANPTLPADRNPLAAAFDAAADRNTAAVALRENKLGLWNEISWINYRRLAQSACRRIQQAGVRPGDAVLIVARPAVAWLSAFMGAVMAGAVVVLLDESAASADIVAALASIRLSAAFTDTHSFERLIAASAPGVAILTMDDGDDVPMRGSFNAGSPARDDAGAASASRQLSDVALVAFTAGTTSGPRPLRFTYANVLNAMEHGPEAAEAEGERLAFASLARVHNLMFHVLAPLLHGGVTNFAESARTVANDLREVAPTALTGSPRFWCNLRNTICCSIFQAVRPGRFLLGQAMSRPRPSFADRMLLSLVRRRFGLHRLHLALVQGPLPAATVQWFERLGIHVSSRYTVTELCGIVLDGPEHSTQHELCLGADDEILIRSPVLPADRLDSNGWFHTGDAGQTGRDGRITVLGRLGVAGLAGIVEREIAKSEYVVDCVVSGGSEDLAVVIAVDEHARLAAQSRRLGWDRQDEAIIDLLDADLGRIASEHGWLRSRAAITIAHVDAQGDDARFTACSRLRRGQATVDDQPGAASRHSIERETHV